MSQFICQEDTDYPTVQSCEIPFSSSAFHMNTGECTKSLTNGMCFGCFPPLALTPQKVASPYIYPIDLNNGEQNSEDNLNRR